MKLNHYTQGHDNNFNLIRIIAAFCVLISHSFPLSGSIDAFYNHLNISLGTIAVEVFFFISGLLVTQSILTRKSAIEFIVARALRILPALWVMGLLITFVVGAAVTALPFSNFISSSITYSYVFKVCVIIFGFNYPLPEVFTNNPYAGVINGSLWSITYECRMYIVLLGLWVIAANAPNFVFHLLKPLKITRDNFVQISTLMLAVVGFFYVMAAHVLFEERGPVTQLFAQLVFFFFLGGSCTVLKNHIPLKRILFWGSVMVLLGSAFDKELFFYAYQFTLPYIVLFCAYVPAGFVRGYNRIGDYSYGVYLYAFPIQQAVVHFMPQISAINMMIIAGAATLTCAITSWHIIEKLAMAKRKWLVGLVHRPQRTNTFRP